MSDKPTPPPALDCARVLHFALLDGEVQFVGRSLLFVDGKELGRVPCLAICQDKTDILLFHCSSEWSVLGCSAHKSVPDAKARAESIYHGVSNRWMDANVSPEKAGAYLNHLFGDQRCSICGRRPDEVNSLIQKDLAWVCNHCVGLLA